MLMKNRCVILHIFCFQGNVIQECTVWDTLNCTKSDTFKPFHATDLLQGFGFPITTSFLTFLGSIKRE